MTYCLISFKTNFRKFFPAQLLAWLTFFKDYFADHDRGILNGIQGSLAILPTGLGDTIQGSWMGGLVGSARQQALPYVSLTGSAGGLILNEMGLWPKCHPFLLQFLNSRQGRGWTDVPAKALLFAALATFLSETFWAMQWPARLWLLLLVNISAETLVSVSLHCGSCWPLLPEIPAWPEGWALILLSLFPLWVTHS